MHELLSSVGRYVLFVYNIYKYTHAHMLRKNKCYQHKTNMATSLAVKSIPSAMVAKTFLGLMFNLDPGRGEL